MRSHPSDRKRGHGYVSFDETVPSAPQDLYFDRKGAFFYGPFPFWSKYILAIFSCQENCFFRVRYPSGERERTFYCFIREDQMWLKIRALLRFVAGGFDRLSSRRIEERLTWPTGPPRRWQDREWDRRHSHPPGWRE